MSAIRLNLYMTKVPAMTTHDPSAATAARDDDQRWRAIRANDEAADGRFFYAVKTTGVYCRPSCSSRLPKRSNVAFYDSAQQAERAGFRPCKRCLPARQTPAERDTARVVRACRLIEAADAVPSLDTLAAEAGLSRYHFHRLFKRITGLTPHQYGLAFRDQRLQSSLQRGGAITDTMLASGFNSSGHFHDTTEQTLGMSATRYRDGGPGAVIRFAVGDSALGSVLVAGTERGICAITLGDDPDTLVRTLQDQFTQATLIGDDEVFQEHVARVVGFIDAPGADLNLPLDIQGTSFQRRVWQALRGIPVGETASYAAIAARMGAPKSVRAVAGACAANKLAIAIPCHRVVRSDGSLSGYRWGVERKRALLRREADR